VLLGNIASFSEKNKFETVSKQSKNITEMIGPKEDGDEIIEKHIKQRD
jgi:hypothetical protein